MSSEGYSDVFYKGPAYALVIGISSYKYGKAPGQELAPKEFTNLKLAAKDAEDFATFLKGYGFIEYNVQLLLNDQADRPSIIDEFEKLRKYCKQLHPKDPLVIVYFSGHGMADAEERHYLIPYDAERDRLRATAFSNKDFSDCLKELETNRLVVFLDACHAGAMGMEDVKGALQQYNAHKDLGEGGGRYLIASCKPGQKSYELEENGIFTGHLLELLKCETDDFDKEEIDIFDLYPVLRDKVKTTASIKYTADQEPLGTITGATGIILAINQRVRQERIQEDEQAREEKRKFLETICDQIKKLAPPQKTMLTEKLRNYVDKGEKVDGHDEFYALFDEYLELWQPDENTRIEECCQLLISRHSDIIRSGRLPKESHSQGPSEPVGKFVDATENKVIGSQKSPTPRTPTPSLDQQQPRRRLSSEDRDYILGEIMGKLPYYSEARALINILSQPVSEEEFTKTIHGIESKKNEKTLSDMVQEIINRFLERWPQAAVVETKTLSSLMMEKVKDE